MKLLKWDAILNIKRREAVYSKNNLLENFDVKSESKKLEKIYLYLEVRK